MLGFVIGLFVGGTVGVTIMSLCIADKPTSVKTAQIRTDNFIGFGDSNSERIVVSLLVKRR